MPIINKTVGFRKIKLKKNDLYLYNLSLSFFFCFLGNGVLISPSSKQHETCQSVPRSPQTQHHHHHHPHHQQQHPHPHHPSHQLYSTEQQQQQFISIPHTPVYADLQPYPSSTTSTDIVYSDNGPTSSTTNYYTADSSPSPIN